MKTFTTGKMIDKLQQGQTATLEDDEEEQVYKDSLGTIRRKHSNSILQLSHSVMRWKWIITGKPIGVQHEKTCEECGEPFMSKRVDAAVCGETCRKRRQRRIKREEDSQ